MGISYISPVINSPLCPLMEVEKKPGISWYFIIRLLSINSTKDPSPEPRVIHIFGYLKL